MKIKEMIEIWESNDQSGFYSLMLILSGWLFLTIGHGSPMWMCVVGIIFCFSYAAYKVYSCYIRVSQFNRSASK